MCVLPPLFYIQIGQCENEWYEIFPLFCNDYNCVMKLKPSSSVWFSKLVQNRFPIYSVAAMCAFKAVLSWNDASFLSWQVRLAFISNGTKKYYACVIAEKKKIQHAPSYNHERCAPPPAHQWLTAAVYTGRYIRGSQSLVRRTGERQPHKCMRTKSPA